jgi:hypothetical protein
MTGDGPELASLTEQSMISPFLLCHVARYIIHPGLFYPFGTPHHCVPPVNNLLAINSVPRKLMQKVIFQLFVAFSQIPTYRIGANGQFTCFMISVFW